MDYTESQEKEIERVLTIALRELGFRDVDKDIDLLVELFCGYFEDVTGFEFDMEKGDDLFDRVTMSAIANK